MTWDLPTQAKAAVQLQNVLGKSSEILQDVPSNAIAAEFAWVKP